MSTPLRGVFFYFRPHEILSKEAKIIPSESRQDWTTRDYIMKLTLEDKSVFEGESFGASLSVAGEVVFTTGMTGYVESLSDPSYAGQILVCTYPLIGNYGVPASRFFESEKIQVAGLVVGEYIEKYSHSMAKESLGEWFRRSGVPAMTGVDTRAITKILRARGVMLGYLSDLSDGKIKVEFYDPNKENLVARVSCKKSQLKFIKKRGSGKK